MESENFNSTMQYSVGEQEMETEYNWTSMDEDTHDSDMSVSTARFSGIESKYWMPVDVDFRSILMNIDGQIWAKGFCWRKRDRKRKN